MLPKLNKVTRLDSIDVNETYFTDEGYLIDHPILTSVGIFEYHNDDGSVRRELRLPEDVFEPESLASYKGHPIIITHAAGEINKSNAVQNMVGSILSDGYKDGQDVKAQIIIYDTDTVKQCGLRQLSLGYDTDLEETPGTYNGQPYDAIQRNIRINHLALVSEARAGAQAHLNMDSKDAKTFLKGGKKEMSKRADGVLSPEEFAASLQGYLAQKNGGAAPAPIAPVNSADAETEPQKPGDAPVQEKTDIPTPTAGGENAMSNADKIAQIRQNKDKRDGVDSPVDMQSALQVIEQLTADLDSLLEIADGMSAAADMSMDGCGKEDGEDVKKEDGTFPPAKKEEGELKDAGKEEPAEGEEKTPAKEEKKTMNMDSIDVIVSQKLELGEVGRKLHLDGLEKMDIRSARKKVIMAVKPSMRLDGKTDSYILAAYEMAKDMAMSRKSTNDQRMEISRGMHMDSSSDDAPCSAAQARANMIARRENRNGGNE